MRWDFRHEGTTSYFDYVGCIKEMVEMIPDNIKVGGLVYKVELKPVVVVEDDRNYQGACDYLKTTIEILDSASVERQDDVFIHELTHAIFYEAGYEQQEEDMINRVGKVIHQVLKDNPNLGGENSE